LHHDGQIKVLYDDGEKERLELDNKIWMYESSTDAVTASSGAVKSDNLYVTGTETAVLASVVKHFGNEIFLTHQAQGFEQFPLVKAQKN